MPHAIHPDLRHKTGRALASALPLLLVLLLCTPVRAAGVDTTAGATNIVISGDGSTVAYTQGDGIHATSGAFSDGSLAVPGSTLVDVTRTGWILGQTAGAYHLYNGTTDVNVSDTVTYLGTAAGISPDGLWIFGTDTSGRTALWSTTSLNWDSYYTEFTDTSDAFQIRALSDVSSNGRRYAVGQRTTYNVPWVYRFDPSHGSGMASTELTRTSSVTSYGSTTGAGTDITRDGSIAVGYLDNGERTYAAKWYNLQTNPYGNLYILPTSDDGQTYTNTSAYAVNDSGSVIVGTASGAYTTAAYWTGSGTSYTLRTLYDDLTGKGVSLPSASYLREALGVSDDGAVIVGTTDTHEMYIARLSGGASSGVITVGQFDQSLGTMGQVGPAVANMGQISMSRLGSVAIGQGTRVAVAGRPGQRGLSSGDEMPGSLDLWMIGSVGTNIELNGDDLGLHGGLGLSWDNGGEWRFGAGLFGDDRDLDTDHGGNQRIKALGPGAFVVYSPQDTGFSFRVSALWQPVSLKLKRGYANGAGSATSTGSTDAEVFGLSGRAQWTTALTDTLALTPFAEYIWQNTHIDGYSESGGPFPASYGSRNETSNSIRTGLLADFALFENLGTWTWAAWNHRFEDDTSSLAGIATGLGAFSYPGAKVDQDWADLGVGVTRQFSNRLTANASLGGALGCDDDSVPDLTVSVGFNYQLW